MWIQEVGHGAAREQVLDGFGRELASEGNAGSMKT